jgi:hypothetical protein
LGFQRILSYVFMPFSCGKFLYEFCNNFPFHLKYFLLLELISRTLNLTQDCCFFFLKQLF